MNEEENLLETKSIARATLAAVQGLIMTPAVLSATYFGPSMSITLILLGLSYVGVSYYYIKTLSKGLVRVDYKQLKMTLASLIGFAIMAKFNESRVIVTTLLLVITLLDFFRLLNKDKIKES